MEVPPKGSEGSEREVGLQPDLPFALCLSLLEALLAAERPQPGEMQGFRAKGRFSAPSSATE